MTTAAMPQLEGELPPFLRRTLGLRSLRRFRYDSIERVRIGEAVFLLTHPDDIRHVLVTNAVNYTKTPRLVGKRGRRRAGTGLLTATGNEHLRQRRLLLPFFRRDAVALLDRTIHDAAVEMLDRWGTSVRIDLGLELTGLARSIMLTTLFGRELGDAELHRLGEAIGKRRRFTELVYHGRLPFRDSLPTPTVRHHRRALEAIDATIYGAIDRRREGGLHDGDLIAQLIAARYDDGSAMSDREVRDEVLTFMSTGYETLAEALTWALYLLARHPDTDEELHTEVAGVLGGRLPAADDLESLPFTGMVLAETLRLYPPTWLYVRVPIAADVLPRAGAVAAGATLYVCPYVLHRHPRYFPEPERFDPHRFAPGRRPPRYVYLPFGDGLHRCLGEHLARLEAALVIALVAQRYRIRLDSGATAEPHAGVTLRPGRAIWATAEPRTAGSARAR